jgi:hypothetical protein
MARAAIEQILFLMDEAFEGHPEHALLRNLKDLSDDDLRWVPDGAARSPFQILEHVGDCKYVYENHAFGDGSMRWDRPGSVPSIPADASKEAIIAWVSEGQRRLRSSVAALVDDAELVAMRRANWGQEYETRWLINTMVQHDLYHGGEINHIRALRQGNDRWAYDESSP